MSEFSHPGLSRRNLIKAALAIGGSSALSACASEEGTDSASNTATYPLGGDPDSLPERQHAWSEYLIRDRFGNTVNPQHQLILLLDYVGDVPPSKSARTAVADSLRGVERAIQWGTGERTDAVEMKGLLFTLGYSRSYFEQVAESTPETVRLQSPTEVITRLNESARPDQADAALVMASDYASLLLEVEQALFGERETLNGQPVPATREVFERSERRTGFIGHGLPAEKLDQEEIPEQSPLSMGFKSGFHDNIPSEDKVTIQEGMFAEGTTQLISRLSLDLDSWYDRSKDDQISLMFSPHHSREEVGEAGIQLAQDSGITNEMTEDLDSAADSYGCLGHSQKAAAARDDEFDPIILRRSESVATDASGVEFNFTSVQKTIENFVRTRKAMNQPETDEIPKECHGILSFMDVKTRGTYLIPPRSRRALPIPGRTGENA